jgi:hypothetical protein
MRYPSSARFSFLSQRAKMQGWLAFAALAAACAAGGGGKAPASDGGTGNVAGSAGSIGTGGVSGSIGVGGTAGTILPPTGSGGTAFDGGVCEGFSQAAENQVRPVDIIWAIDNSESMFEEAEAVQANMNTFANTILSQGIDVHVAMISQAGPPYPYLYSHGVCIPEPLGSGSCPDDSRPPVYLRVDQTVGSTNALDLLIARYPDYKPVLRQNAVKYFAVVSDDTTGMLAQDFIDAVGALDPAWFDTWRFFGVFCTGSCATESACVETGTVYLELTEYSNTAPGDLCAGQSNFAGVFSALAQAVVSGTTLDCRWQIPPPPAGQSFDRTKLNVDYTPGGSMTTVPIYHAGESAAACGPEGGWYYDDLVNPTQIIVCPATCNTISNDLTGRIDILFGCETVVVPK